MPRDANVGAIVSSLTHGISRMLPVRILIFAGVLASSAAAAQGTANDLKRCLEDLGGVAWRLPYAPRISVTYCVSPAASYNPRGGKPAAIRELSLRASFEAVPDEQDMPWDERRMAAQSAALAHFEALFRSHGYRAVSPGRYQRGDGLSLTWKAQGDDAWTVVVEGPP
jgi:hypothetical protein